MYNKNKVCMMSVTMLYPLKYNISQVQLLLSDFSNGTPITYGLQDVTTGQWDKAGMSLDYNEAAGVQSTQHC